MSYLGHGSQKCVAISEKCVKVSEAVIVHKKTPKAFKVNYIGRINFV